MEKKDFVVGKFYILINNPTVFYECVGITTKETPVLYHHGNKYEFIVNNPKNYAPRVEKKVKKLYSLLHEDKSKADGVRYMAWATDWERDAYVKSNLKLNYHKIWDEEIPYEVLG